MAAAPVGGGARSLSQRELDIQMMLAADFHAVTKNYDFQMERYVYKRRTDDSIINLGEAWEKLQLATRVFVPIEDLQDIIVQSGYSGRPYGLGAVLKFVQSTGAHAIAGRHTRGTLTTNKHQPVYRPQKPSAEQPRRRMRSRRWPCRRE